MNKRALLVGMAVWLTLLGLGILWATNPAAKPPATNISTITQEQTERAFAIRLASLHPRKPSVVSHIRAAEHALEEGEQRTTVRFDYEEWSFRELRARLIAFFCVWMIGGFAVHWIARRVFRDQQSVA